MDTSETYMKMCDYPKIQRKIQECGDDYNRFGHIEMTKEHIKAVWLPRQDQIQKMMDFQTYQVGAFSNYVHGHKPEEWEKFKTMEQLWLAYYMDEKHNLIWENDKWKREE